MNLPEIENEVITLTRSVARFILNECINFDRAHIEQKQGFNNLVSYVDKEAELRIVSRLKEVLPEAGFITEEGTVEQASEAPYKWIIDPLDGTTNFLHGLPVYAISIGLAYHDEVVLGVVHDINRDECFHASKGRPAYMNEKEIKVSSLQSLQESLLATGFPYYMFDKKDVYLDIIQHFLTQTHGIRRLGSAAIDLAYVACGRLEGFFEYNLNPWDVAAGTFIVQQAGGVVTDFRGGNQFLFGGELCACCAGVHADMLAIIKKHWWA